MEGLSYNKKSILEKMDDTPQAGSKNAVTSEGIAAADAVLAGNIQTLGTQIGQAFYFKGSSTYANLPQSGNTVNDTYYVTDNDKKCWYTWNGTAWIQSSLNQSDYDGIIAQLRADMSHIYSPSSPYQVGDYVINQDDSKLYVCKTAITVPEAFNSAHWEQAVLSDAIGNIVMVTDTQPTTAENKIWLASDSAQGIQVPTMTDVNNIVAAEYSATATYNVGDYCIHNDLYYRCNTSIPSGGEVWTDAHWTQTNVGTEITSVNNNFEKNIQRIWNDSYTLKFRRGRYLYVDDQTPVDIDNPSDANYMCGVVECSQGDVFNVNLSTNSSTSAVMFLNSNKLVIERQGTSAGVLDLGIVAPENSAYVCFNTQCEQSATPYYDYYVDVRSTTFEGYINLLGITSLASLKKTGYYSCPSSYLSNLTDLPEGFTDGTYGDINSFILVVREWANKSTVKYYNQELHSRSGKYYVRQMTDTSIGDWNTRQFDCRYYISTESTDLLTFFDSGWYYGDSASREAVQSDLPEGISTVGGITLLVYNQVRGDGTHIYIMQELSDTDLNCWRRIIYRSEETGYIHKNWKRISYLEGVDPFWNSKKIAWFGDSLSYGSGLSDTSNAYPYLVATKLSATISNYAVGGSVLAKQTQEEATAAGAGYYDDIVLSLEEWNNMTRDISKKYLVLDDPTQSHPYRIYSYVSDQWTPTSAYTSVVNGRYPIVDVVKQVTSDDDLIVIALGYNDFMYHWTPFGTMSDRTKNTFYGALHTTCLYLLENFPTKQIAFVSVISSRYQLTGHINADWSCTTPDSANPLGKTIGDYADAVKEVCNYYSIPFIDLGHNLGWAQFQHPSTYLVSDNLHWNVDGHKRAASVLLPMIDNLRKRI